MHRLTIIVVLYNYRERNVRQLICRRSLEADDSNDGNDAPTEAARVST